MQPVLATFTIGGAEVVLRAYSTFYVLAWIAAVILATIVARRKGISWRPALVIFVAALLAGAFGARLTHIAFNWSYYADDLGRIYHPGFRGFNLYGGLLPALAAGALLTRAFRLPLWRVADTTVPALATGIVLMRTGCFLNGCCFGTTTALPWGVTYPMGSPAWKHQVLLGELPLMGLIAAPEAVHPTQLYEVVAAVAFSGLAAWLWHRRSAAGPPAVPAGVPFLVFALGFTLFRLGNHFLRVEPATAAAPTWSYPLVYALISACAMGLILWRLRRARHAMRLGAEGSHHVSR